MKKIFATFLLALLVLGMKAQNLDNLSNEELIERIKWFHQCFIEISLPTSHEESITLSSGKVVNMLAQSDYERSAFVSVDKLLEDVHQWKLSPYLWQMNHSKNNSAIMDGKDLSNWEIESFDQIAQSYFKNSVSTYHIAAHGLVFEDTGEALDRIKIGGQELDASETAELIIKSMQGTFHHVINAENQPFVVVVHCCHTAEGEDNFSSQLSKELAKYIPNVSVVGAPDVVRCEVKEGKYTEFVTTKSEAKKEDAQKLKWKVYKNGENTCQGKFDYLETVSAIQGVQ